MEPERIGLVVMRLVTPSSTRPDVRISPDPGGRPVLGSAESQP